LQRQGRDCCGRGRLLTTRFGRGGHGRVGQGRRGHCRHKTDAAFLGLKDRVIEKDHRMSCFLKD